MTEMKYSYFKTIEMLQLIVATHEQKPEKQQRNTGTQKRKMQEWHVYLTYLLE